MSNKEKQRARYLYVTGPDDMGSMYVRIRKCKMGGSVKQVPISGLADYDREGRLLGLEILDVLDKWPKK